LDFVEMGDMKPSFFRFPGPALIAAVVALALAWLLIKITGFSLIKTSWHSIPLAESVASTPSSVSPGAGKPKNIIIVMADGLGFAHLSAARVVNHGIRSPVSWDRFEAYGWHHPHPVKGLIIDSAGSGTALATGLETRYGAAGIGADGESLTSLFELGHERGYRLGVVTDSYIWDATPAAFVTETADRDDAADILRQLAGSELEVLFGELEDVGEGDVPEKQPTLELLQQRFVLLDSTLQGPPPPTPVAMVVDEDDIGDLDSQPTLPQMVDAALLRLASDDRPFLLLVESEEPDAASHDNDFKRLLRGMEALEATLTMILDFAQSDGSTLVLFTSDHETAGLALSIGDNTNMNLQPQWSSDGHTGVAVPVMASGPGAANFGGIHSTAQLGQMLALLLGS
jgi:alkaline phosphatase